MTKSDLTIFYIIGATGLVGRKILDVMLERGFSNDMIKLFASERSAGEIVSSHGKNFHVRVLKKSSIMQQMHSAIAIFSAGASISKKFAPYFVEKGITVIDNSSFWRMNQEVPLIIPEVNGSEIKNHKGIIANPNCSTIQMLMVLKPLHDMFKVKRVVVSTYQSVSGSGKKGIQQLDDEMCGKKTREHAYPYQIKANAIPHIDVFLDSGYSREEWKMIVETKKILDQSIEVAPTAVRIPTSGGHSESLNIEFENNFEINKIRDLLEKFSGLSIQDDLKNNLYPMPLTAHDKDDVFVGRIRRDPSIKNGLHLWVVSDNLRKGAATNAVQIAELLLETNDHLF